MKTFSGTGPRPKPKRASALNCLLVNQFATPGLGSLMGGRILAGSIQLSLALAGFTLATIWIVLKSMNAYRQAFELPLQPDSHSWMGTTGFILFAASWLLSWFTSLSLLHQAQTGKIPDAKTVPPLLRP